MKETEEQLIWRYLDGTLSEAEKVRLDQHRKNDPAFREALAEREALHRQLQEATPEQPSLRFVRNVMENLPAIYRRAVEPLVQPLWIKIFFGTLGVFLISYFIMVAYYVQKRPIDDSDQVVSITGRIGQFFLGLPQQLFTIIAALSIGFLILVLLDHYLKGRAQKTQRL